MNFEFDFPTLLYLLRFKCVIKSADHQALSLKRKSRRKFEIFSENELWIWTERNREVFVSGKKRGNFADLRMVGFAKTPTLLIEGEQQYFFQMKTHFPPVVAISRGEKCVGKVSLPPTFSLFRTHCEGEVSDPDEEWAVLFAAVLFFDNAVATPHPGG